MVTSGPVDCGSLYDDYPDTQNNPSVVCLSTGAAIGLSFHAQSALLSLSSLLILLFVIARKYRNSMPNPQTGSRQFFRSNMDILMSHLIVADIVMSLGTAPSAYWAYRRQVYIGPACSAQGALKTMGETAVALSTFTVAVYTFLVIRLNRSFAYSPRRCLMVIAAIWLWVLCCALIPLSVLSSNGEDSDGAAVWYTPTPWWCWINGRYLAMRIIAEYLWIWITCITSIILYVWAYVLVHKDSSEQHVTASKMLYYPLAYTFCVLPFSTTRWAGFRNPDLLRDPSMGAPEMVFGAAFSLMGFIDVALILWSRPGVLLLGFDGYSSTEGSLAEISQQATQAQHPVSDGSINQEEGVEDITTRT